MARHTLALVIFTVGCSHSPMQQEPPPDLAMAEAPTDMAMAVVTPQPDAAPFEYTRPPGVATCYSSLSQNDPATTNFFNALLATDYASRAAANHALAEAENAHPNEEEFALLNGLANLWRIVEPAPGEEADKFGQILAALRAKNELERAFQLCPTDYRIPAWLGPLDVTFGRQGGGQGFIDQGLMVLQTGIDHYPAFVLFSKVLIYADRPPTDPDFLMAVDAVDQSFVACGDLTTTHDPACMNTPHAPHNIEGSVTHLGDAYAKAGRRDDALMTYAGAMRSSTYNSWPFRAFLEDHIANIDTRIAAYAAGQEPEAAWNSKIQCAICHQQ